MDEESTEPTETPRDRDSPQGAARPGEAARTADAGGAAVPRGAAPEPPPNDAHLEREDAPPDARERPEPAPLRSERTSALRPRADRRTPAHKDPAPVPADEPPPAGTAQDIPAAPAPAEPPHAVPAPRAPSPSPPRDAPPPPSPYAPAPQAPPPGDYGRLAPAGWEFEHAGPPSWWRRRQRTLRALGLVVLLALSGLMILVLVRQQTGTAGLLVGFGLALFPVPLLVAAFRWLDAVEPTPWRNHLFAFAWGACAATLVALVTNGFATDWLASTVVVESSRQVDTLGATVVAPVVEELVKGAAVLLLFLFRRQHLTGVVSAIAVAGITAAGFAFTENILYLGTAYDTDSSLGPDPVQGSATVATFFIRIVLAPFAHPLFTALTGIGVGLLAALPRHRRVLRACAPVLGLLTAMLLHAIWNGSASFTDLTFLVVYGIFMVPVAAALTWLAIWSRQNELRAVRTTLADYAEAGWFAPPEPWALGTMRARSSARAAARHHHGKEAAATVAEYQQAATALALLRTRAEEGAPPDDFAAREQELLHRVEARRALARPATVRAALTLAGTRAVAPPAAPYGYGHHAPAPSNPYAPPPHGG
ncbi:PrsW family intramembrane metalloprotease [Streptomyces xiaopingdaonensis]|uniref:PrsW family intramembrane metalloprotease n=1 Tax=Streptomyces xiaopingdaonensis TaxID=1565415 RepID=UPI00031DE342|nr:PrsW family glutamic-type intramembrane protease [Streptomyces xiaopingdaonensis]